MKGRSAGEMASLSPGRVEEGLTAASLLMMASQPGGKGDAEGRDLNAPSPPLCVLCVAATGGRKSPVMAFRGGRLC